MPIYAWQCQNCGEEIEILQKMDDSSPICSNEKCKDLTTEMIRVFTKSNIGLIFKGKGFYTTDYKGKK